MKSSPLIIVITAQHEKVLYENYPTPMRVCCLCKPVTHSKLAASLASIFNTKPSCDEKSGKIPASPKVSPSFPNFASNIGSLDICRTNFHNNTNNNSNYNNLNNNNYNNLNNNNYNLIDNSNHYSHTATNSNFDNKISQTSLSTNNTSIYHINNNKINENNHNVINVSPERVGNNNRTTEYTLLIHTLVVEGICFLPPFRLPFPLPLFLYPFSLSRSPLFAFLLPFILCLYLYPYL